MNKKKLLNLEKELAALEAKLDEIMVAQKRLGFGNADPKQIGQFWLNITYKMLGTSPNPVSAMDRMCHAINNYKPGPISIEDVIAGYSERKIN